MTEDGWKVVYKGIRVKKHPSRKHGIKPDQYFTVRFQFNGKRINSGLGWASEGWTLEKAIVRMQELKEESKQGGGIRTHRERQIEADEQRKKQEIIEKEHQEQENKNAITLKQYFNETYYPSIKQEKKFTSHIKEEQHLRIWIDPVIGEKPLKEISTFDIERLKSYMMKAGKSPRTIQYVMTTLGQIFRHAQKFGCHSGEIPTLSVKKIRFDNKRVRFLSLEESHRLLNALKESSQQLYEMALISLHCGLRAGEIFSLQWKDVDLEHGLITLLDTKSGRTRTLSMTDDIKEILTLEGEREGIVFPARNGRRIDKISNSFFKAVDKAGLNNGVTDRRQKVTFHTLRHTFASWLVMEGISLYQVKELLGHASLTMTERYSHLAPDKNRLAAETMGKIFRKPTESKMVNIR